MSDELAYWRALAEERGRALETMQKRWRNALAVVPNEHYAMFAAALDGRLGGWMQEPERMAPLAQLIPTDVVSALEDLWNRVDADGGE